MKYKHVSFDLWKTLIVKNPKNGIEKRHILYSFFKEKSKLKISYDEFGVLINKAEGMFNKYHEIYYSQKNCQLNKSQILFLMLKSIDLNIDLSLLDICFLMTKLESCFLQNPPILIDGVEETISFLKDRNVGITLLSNTNLITSTVLIKCLPILSSFDRCFFSDATDLVKPNPIAFGTVYSYAVKRDKTIKPKEILHIGDSALCDYFEKFSCLSFDFRTQNLYELVTSIF